MKTCLFVATSVDTLAPGGQPTGLWLSGLTHPYFELMQAGFDCDIASPKGGAAPIDPFSDPWSVDSVARDDLVSQGFITAHQHGSALEHTLALADVDPRRYRAIIICGGNGALRDLAANEDLRRILTVAWQTGRIVASISQGLAALLSVQSMLPGHVVTGPSKEQQIIAEHLVGAPYYPYSFEELTVSAGARFEKRNAYAPHVQVSGEGCLITAQNHSSAQVFGQALVAQLTGQGTKVSTADDGQYKPRSGLLGALNDFFHQDYEELVALTVLSLEQMHTPVIVLMGDELIYRQDGQREVATVVPDLYHSLKAIGHALFDVYLSLEVRRPNGLNETELVRIAQQRHLIEAALRHLPDEGLPPQLQQTQVELLTEARDLLSDVLASKTIDEARVRRFAREMGARTAGNNTCAQHQQLDGIHRQMNAWLSKMSPAARERLYIVVGGAHQSRYQDVAMTYFTELMGEVATPGAYGEDRVLYIEGNFDEDKALDLVARHVIDQDAGVAFFDDRRRMQRDLLSDGVDDYVRNLLADCPFYRGQTDREDRRTTVSMPASRGHSASAGRCPWHTAQR